jgi:hypothetical protein
MFNIYYIPLIFVPFTQVLWGMKKYHVGGFPQAAHNIMGETVQAI